MASISTHNTHNAIQERGCAYKITHSSATSNHGVKLKLRQWLFIHCRLCKLSNFALKIYFKNGDVPSKSIISQLLLFIAKLKLVLNQSLDIHFKKMNSLFIILETGPRMRGL